MTLTTGILLAVIALLTVIVLIGGYRGGWQWTGFPEYTGDHPDKRPVTLWMWLSVLIVPLTVGVVGVLFTVNQHYTALAVQDQQAKDQALQAYLDNMGTLLVKEGLAAQYPPSPSSPENIVAQMHTTALLDRVGPDHKATILRFLLQADLITRQDVDWKKRHSKVRVLLERANLREADLDNAYLANAHLKAAFLNNARLADADLRGADLSMSFLNGANLSGADLSTLTMPSEYVLESNLQGSNFEDAVLEGTKLQGADLRHAHNLTQEQIEKAEGDESTKLPEYLHAPESWTE